MTNIIKENIEADVHLHIEEAFEIIDLWLPKNYVPAVLEKVPTGEKIPSGQTIRNVRTRANKKLEISYLNVINLLVEVAKENKLHSERLKELVSDK